MLELELGLGLGLGLELGLKLALACGTSCVPSYMVRIATGSSLGDMGRGESRAGTKITVCVRIRVTRLGREMKWPLEVKSELG